MNSRQIMTSGKMQSWTGNLALCGLTQGTEALPWLAYLAKALCYVISVLKTLNWDVTNTGLKELFSSQSLDFSIQMLPWKNKQPGTSNRKLGTLLPKGPKMLPMAPYEIDVPLVHLVLTPNWSSIFRRRLSGHGGLLLSLIPVYYILKPFHFPRCANRSELS